MKILVTGGAGFIGSHLVDALMAKGHDVVVIDDLSNGSEDNLNAKATLIKHDIRDDMEEIFLKEKPAVAFHMAAQINVTKSFLDPEFDEAVNVEGTRNIITACKASNVKKIIFSSTSAVYGDAKDLPIKEGAAKKPISQYGKTKLKAEELIEQSGIPYVIFRYSNVYGPRQGRIGEGGVVAIFSGVIANFDRKFLAAEPLLIYGDGGQTRDFIYVSDIVEANIQSMTGVSNIILNISTNTETTISDLAQIMLRLAHSKVEISYGPEREGDIKFSRLDNVKAIEQLKWKPIMGIEKGISQTIKFFKS